MLSSLLRVCIREKMEDVREPRCTGCPDLTAFCWRSEGDELDMCECFGFVVTYVASTCCAAICFELCCLIVGEIFFQSTQLSGVNVDEANLFN